MSKSHDIGRVRDRIEMGWEFIEVARSPYVKRDQPAPLTAHFEFVHRINGVKQDSQQIVRPNFKALTEDEILEGFQAYVHAIPDKVIERGIVALSAALNPVAQAEAKIIPFRPDHAAQQKVDAPRGQQAQNAVRKLGVI